MKILIVDSHGSHAPVVKLIQSLGAYDIVYYSDTRSAPLDELSAFTRVSRILTLLHTHSRSHISVAVLVGRGMSSPPRDAIELGASRAGIKLIHSADLLTERACYMPRPGGLCLIGDSCLTKADLRDRLGRRELFEIRWCRIAPVYGLDEPLGPILKGWARSVGGYVLATPDNTRVAAQIARHDPGADIVDEHEHLALALAERLPESPAGQLRVCVTEQTHAVSALIKSRLAMKDVLITEMGLLEPAPTEGPFAISLDADGEPA
ncbi:hypothetical protein [Sorangium sp. So ce1182]|uniref:hypothetical protein n=1 Tax=Sorangium sp. So ce1182 TaxID=3133334 RepID=UPI003F5E1381